MQIMPCHVTNTNLHAYYKLWDALMMFLKRQLNENPILHLLGGAYFWRADMIGMTAIIKGP